MGDVGEGDALQGEALGFGEQYQVDGVDRDLLAGNVIDPMAPRLVW